MNKLYIFLNYDPIVRYGILISSVIIVSSLVFLLLRFPVLPTELPLFYSRPWGDEQLGTPLELFILPAGAFFVLIINSYFSYRVLSRWLLLSRILSVGAAVVSVLSFIALFKIITLIS